MTIQIGRVYRDILFVEGKEETYYLFVCGLETVESKNHKEIFVKYYYIDEPDHQWYYSKLSHAEKEWELIS
jgi:hypothetical protein